ncbi:hypothetical protein MHM39_14870 [Phaeobacter sp. CNT1-3]|nr:hypothetical protein [Phaeobacter sp. CNT1-3]
MGKYAQQAKAYVKARKAHLKYIAGEAVQDVVEAAQTTQLGITRGATSFEEGKIPVASADLVNSLVSSINGGAQSKGAASYATVIAAFDIGDVMTFEWPKEYAMRIEYGFQGTDSKGRTYNVPGRHFVGANVARFSDFVEQRAAEVRGK